VSDAVAGNDPVTSVEKPGEVWVPAGKPYAALEPMTTATNSLVDGSAPLVQPGDAYTARFGLVMDDM